MSYLLQDVFMDSVQAYPDRIAILSEGGERLTYGALNERANAFAHLFLECKENLRKRPFVGILSSVKISSIAAVLGCLKIGCAYVPLDEQSPIDRLLSIIDNCQLDIIVIDPLYFEKYKAFLENRHLKYFIFTDPSDAFENEKIIPYDRLSSMSISEVPPMRQVSDDLAYILHSSGSTGVPKGIMLTHRNARTFVDWMHKEFQVQPSDRIMSRAPFKFDLSVFDIFNSLKAGSTLICYDWNRGRRSDERHIDYVKLLVRERASILYTTPSTFIALMNRGALGKEPLSLSRIMYAGEPFSVPQLLRLRERLPNDCKMANIYGPSETNIITYHWIDDLSEEMQSVPLGQEVDDTEILIVSEDGLRICEEGEVGELWCRGGTVTLGYLGMEEKTEACRVLSPFHSFPCVFWRTGDYAFRDEDKRLHYRGRMDHMVKVKGYRIELGEIETALAKQPGIDEFVVVAKADEKYTNRLICYYSLIEGYSCSEQELLEGLKKHIPLYMLPYACIEKKTLPKTSSGKVDRVFLAQVPLYDHCEKM